MCNYLYIIAFELKMTSVTSYVFDVVIISSCILQDTNVKVLPDPDCSLDLSQFELETVKLDTSPPSRDSSFRRYNVTNYNLIIGYSELRRSTIMAYCNVEFELLT